MRLTRLRETQKLAKPHNQTKNYFTNINSYSGAKNCFAYAHSGRRGLAATSSSAADAAGADRRRSYGDAAALQRSFGGKSRGFDVGGRGRAEDVPHLAFRLHDSPEDAHR